jgi:DNA repair exonuclease SbcCD ATPase subunit
MIKKLTYLATFNSTGRTLKNQLNFKPGITVLRGENEAGKSFVFEMIRYALFGSAALRSNRSDYDTLEVKLILEIKGRDYTIIRKGNKATVNINEAVGASSVNDFIVSLLGFNLEVFDICANAQQGELDKLTKDMKPAQRREMVDRVIGLDQFEEVEKECRSESNSFKKLAETLSSQIIELDEPEKPDDYEASETLRARLDKEIHNEALRSSLKPLQPPICPDKPEVSLSVLRDNRLFEIDQAIRKDLKNRLSNLPEIHHPYSLKELELFALSLAQKARGNYPRGYTPKELESWYHAHIQLSKAGKIIKCDNCGSIVVGEELPELPPLSKEEIADERQAQAAWAGYNYDDSLPISPLGLRELKEAKAALEADSERQVLLNQLNSLGPELVDCSEDVAALQKYQESLIVYETQLIPYENYLEKKAEIDNLPAPEPLLREKLDMAIRYEALLGKYEATLEFYVAQELQIAEAEAARDGYKRGSEALKKIRSEIKQYIVPALSKVSSGLLEEMTDGNRRNIIIDDDFEIYVDKQHVRTLSGSGVSVVNLALRVALGQVLTQSVIPFFLADEIDANMAEKRTKATYESLQKLKSRLKQIIVITHKEFEGDEVIWLT